MNNQYINNSTEDENKELKPFNKTGVLQLKNIIDKIEYHLYDKSKPESVDINDTLRIHLYSVIRKPIHISISESNNIIFQGIGKLHRKFEYGVEKYYLDTDTTDIENTILFYNTGKMLNIKLNTVHKEETDEVKEGENKIDEPREGKS